MVLFGKRTRKLLGLPLKHKVPVAVLQERFGTRDYRQAAMMAEQQAETLLEEQRLAAYERKKQMERERQRRKREKERRRREEEARRVRMVGSFVALFEVEFIETGDITRIPHRFQVDELVSPMGTREFAEAMAERYAQLWERGDWSPKGRKGKYVHYAVVMGLNHIHLRAMPQTAVGLETIRMRDARAPLIDGHKKQMWDTRKGKCVIDALQHLYQNVKGMKRAVSTENILQLFSRADEQKVDYLKEGVHTRNIRAWCEAYSIPMYALDGDNRIFYKYEPEKRNKDAPSLVYRLLNGHMYMEESNSKARAVAKRGNDFFNHTHHKVKKTVEKDNIEYLEDVEDTLAFMAQKMAESNTMPYPFKSNIMFSDGVVQSFTLQGKTFVLNQDMENVRFLCERMGREFEGQSLTSLLFDIIKEQTGEKDLPTSYFNPHAYEVMMADNIKSRTHYGCVNGYDEDRIRALEGEGRLTTCDIRKCYTACMYDAYDDWMVFDFNDEWQRWKGEAGNLVRGMYYVLTKDYTLLHGDNVYSDVILNKAMEEGIEFRILMVMRCERVIDKGVVRSVIDKIRTYCEGNDELTKFLCNMLSGYFGKTRKTSHICQMNTNEEEMMSWLHQNNMERLFIHDVSVSDKTYYLYGKTKEARLTETRLPMYIQIKDWANMRLYDMVKSMGGELAYRKVDLAAVVDGRMPETGDVWGAYRVSGLPKKLGMEKRVSARFAAMPRWVPKFVHYGLNDSDQWEDMLNILESNEGLMVMGRAGTGKSYVIKKISQALGKSCKILAPTNKAALNVGGCTIHRFLRMDKQGLMSFEWMKKVKGLYHTIIIDEISMVPGYIWKRLVELKRYTGARFLLVGDYRQCSPVEDEGREHYFDHPAVKFLANNERIELTKPKRYDMELWNVLENVEGYEPSEATGWTKRNICYTNGTRVRVNKILNERHKTADAVRVPAITKDEYTQTVWLHPGLPLIARKNIGGKEEMELINNETYTVKSITTKQVVCVAQRADDEGKPYEHEHTVELEEFQKHFLMNYCSTTHKSQGETITEEYTIWEWQLMDKRLKYTALSRAKRLEQVRFRSMERVEELDRATVEGKIAGHAAYDAKHGMKTDITYEDVRKRWRAQGGMCMRCGCDMKTRGYGAGDAEQMTIDRIDNKMGHTRWNVVLACWRCNRARVAT